MLITDVRIRKGIDGDKVKAYVSITLDNAIVVNDIKIVEIQKGLIVSMPSRKMPDGTYKDICHPINSEARQELEKAIFEKYEAMLTE